jgi:hypothetical protein
MLLLRWILVGARVGPDLIQASQFGDIVWCWWTLIKETELYARAFHSTSIDYSLTVKAVAHMSASTGSHTTRSFLTHRQALPESSKTD